MTHVEAVVPLRPRRKYSRKLPRHNFDRRTRDGRRVKELVAIYTKRLAEAALDPLVKKNIVRCAELTALAESLRAKALQGENVSDDLVRVERLASTAEKSLQLDRKPQHAGPNLAEYTALLKAKEGAT
jgi:hypothetical protein